MARCSSNGDCRQGAGYRCLREGNELLVEVGASITDLGGRRDKGFCAWVGDIGDEGGE